MDSTIQIFRVINPLRKLLMYGLVFLFHLKFIVQVVLKDSGIMLDVLLYLLLLCTIDYRRIRRFIFPILGIAIVSLINPAARNLFLIFLCIYVLSDLDQKSFLCVNLLGSFFVFFLCTFFLVFGITKSELFPMTFLDMRERWDYGMGNPNTFALFVYSIILNLYLLLGQKYKLVLFLIAVVAFWVYLYTGSRTFICAVCVLIVLHFLRIKLSGYCCFVKMVLLISPILLLGIIIFFARNMEEYPIMDIVLSGRLQLYNDFLSSLSLKHYLIGSDLVNEETIDNTFLHVYFEGGILGFFLFYLFFCKMVKKASIKDLQRYLPVFCSVFAMGITESILTFVLLFGNMTIWYILFKSANCKSIVINEVNEKSSTGVYISML